MGRFFNQNRSDKATKPSKGSECKCLYGFLPSGEWGKVFKRCGKSVGFHLNSDGVKVWHRTCDRCISEQAKFFGDKPKVKAKAAPKPKAKSVAKPKAKAAPKVKAKAAPKAAKPKAAPVMPKVVKMARLIAEIQREQANLNQKQAELAELLEAA